MLSLIRYIRVVVYGDFPCWSFRLKLIPVLRVIHGFWIKSLLQSYALVLAAAAHVAETVTHNVVHLGYDTEIRIT
jgi:hypothetical protein